MVLFVSAVNCHKHVQMVCVAVQQFYSETMEVTDEVKPDTADDSKTTSLDNSGTEEVAAVTDTNDVDMKTEEG